MERSQLIKAIQLRIDDIVTDNAIEVLSNPYVDQLLDDQLALAFMYIPSHYLPQKSFASNSPSQVNTVVYSIPLPTDFLKLVRFSTTLYERPITESDLIKEGTSERKLMYQPYTSGGNARPVGLIQQNQSGRVLEYTVGPGSPGAIKEAQYVAKPTADDVTVEILDPVAWYIASSVLQILGEIEASKSALSKVQEFVTTNK